jgi:hypothetical protein
VIARASAAPLTGPARDAWLDYALCGALAVGIMVYLYLWPRDLFGFDEGLYLYESKRLLDGDVFYRDIFEIITPGSFYVMALLFRIFGANIVTARMSTAVLHVLIALTLYAICRTVGVRRSLATAAGVAHLAVCFFALPIASPHWFGTFSMLLVLLLGVRQPTRTRPFMLGLANGLLIAIQQQKGAVMCVAAVVALAAEHLVARPVDRKRLAGVVPDLLQWAGGVAVIVVPLILTLLLTAGIEPTVRALIQHPLVNYRQNLTAEWGSWAPWFPDRYVFPLLIKWQPLVLLVALPRILWRWARSDDPVRLRHLLWLTLMPAFALLSVGYYPNYTHLDIVAPVMLPLVAETLDSMLRFGERRLGAPQWVGTVVALALIARLGVQAEHSLEQHQKAFSLSYDTDFGRIATNNPDQIAVTNTLKTLLPDVPSREIFVYPTYASLYLLTSSSNPTRFEIVLPGYTEADQIAEIAGVLESRKVRYVVRNMSMTVTPGSDDLLPYLHQHYQLVPFPHAQPMSTFLLFKRRDDAPHEQF